MTSKIKTTLLTVICLFGLLTGIQAQDKYEFAILSYSPYHQNITISIGSQKYEVVEVNENNKLKDRNFNAVLAEVNKLQDQGWELFNTQTTGMGTDMNINFNTSNYVFYMRKKK
jgi:hypothetical protein